MNTEAEMICKAVMSFYEKHQGSGGDWQELAIGINRGQSTVSIRGEVTKVEHVTVHEND